MARIRSIKPEFFTSLTIAQLSFTARLTFIGMWTEADDEGRLLYDARLLKGAIWALDERTADDVDSDVRELTEVSLITQYTVGARVYIQINGWKEHQKVNRPSESKYPPPPPVDNPTFPHDFAAGESSLNVHGDFTGGKEQGTGNREQGNNVQPSENACGKPSNTYSEDFKEFWDTYPRREHKPAAYDEFKRALERASLKEILDGARRYAEDPNRHPQFTTMPAKWLKNDGWLDDALPGPETPTAKNLADTERRKALDRIKSDGFVWEELFPDGYDSHPRISLDWREAVVEAYTHGLRRGKAMAWAYEKTGLTPAGQHLEIIGETA